MLESGAGNTAAKIAMDRSDRSSGDQPTEEFVSPEQLYACFQGLASDFPGNMERLMVYYQTHPFNLEYDVLGAFILSLYERPDCPEEVLHMASAFLVRVILGSPPAVTHWLAEIGFITRLTEIVPRGGSMIVLEAAARVSWDAAEAVSTPQMLESLQRLFSPESENTGLAFVVLSRWACSRRSLPPVIEVFRKVAEITTSTSNEQICSDGLFAFGMQGRDHFEIATVFFQCPGTAAFIGNISNQNERLLLVFLRFLDDIFANTESANDVYGVALHESVGFGVINGLLDFLVIPLQSADRMIIGIACRVLAKLIYHQESVDYCFSKGFPEVLFRLLDSVDDFETKVQISRPLCALMNSPNQEQATQLFSLGFAEYLTTYVDSLALEIPYEIIAALNGIVYLSETRDIWEWFELVFENDAIEEALERLCHFDGYPRGYAPYLSCGIDVCQLAQAVYDRRYNHE